ncbi:hypothetical protein [Streptomyces sp. NPDC005209]|uniref:hypothetical protein n=1 Tax=Streptomyces sp. NPDC005209 TaxID=3156715 RepID=UPI0033B5F815
MPADRQSLTPYLRFPDEHHKRIRHNNVMQFAHKPDAALLAEADDALKRSEAITCTDRREAHPACRSQIASTACVPPEAARRASTGPGGEDP